MHLFSKAMDWIHFDLTIGLSNNIWCQNAHYQHLSHWALAFTKCFFSYFYKLNKKVWQHRFPENLPNRETNLCHDWVSLPTEKCLFFFLLDSTDKKRNFPKRVAIWLLQLHSICLLSVWVCTWLKPSVLCNCVCVCSCYFIYQTLHRQSTT